MLEGAKGNLRIVKKKKNKQTFGAKVVSREGNSPDCKIKLLIILNTKIVAWLGVIGRFGSSHPFKKA